MLYRVTFMERTDAAGRPSEFPPDYLAIDAADGVILEQTFVERSEPTAMHGDDRLGEDDDFLSVGSETWDYEVADSRQKEFLAAVQNSQVAIECIPLEESDTPGGP
jgi:hypothetical protein